MQEVYPTRRGNAKYRQRKDPIVLAILWHATVRIGKISKTGKGIRKK